MKGILIRKDLCIGCRACASACEHGIIQILEANEFRKITVSGSCPDGCENCKDVCPTEAIKIEEKPISPQEIIFHFTLCRRCGIPTAPEAMLNFISRRMSQPLFELDLCITCRQQLIWEIVKKG